MKETGRNGGFNIHIIIGSVASNDGSLTQKGFQHWVIGSLGSWKRRDAKNIGKEALQRLVRGPSKYIVKAEFFEVVAVERWKDAASYALGGTRFQVD
jgi:hypothetical protein